MIKDINCKEVSEVFFFTHLSDKNMDRYIDNWSKYFTHRDTYVTYLTKVSKRKVWRIQGVVKPSEFHNFMLSSKIGPEVSYLIEEDLYLVTFFLRYEEDWSEQEARVNAEFEKAQRKLQKEIEEWDK